MATSPPPVASQAQVQAALRQGAGQLGIATGGRKLGLMTEMSQAALKYLSDDEVAAMYAYLSAPEAAAHP